MSSSKESKKDKSLFTFSKTSKKIVGSWLLVLVACASSVFTPEDYFTLCASILSVIIFALYIFTLKLYNENFSDSENKLWMVPLVYSAILLLLALFYCVPVNLLDAVEHEFGFFQSFYFSLITLTTVGYGEFHPSGYTGQVLSLSMAIVGTIHMIMFISILVNNLKRNI